MLKIINHKVLENYTVSLRSDGIIQVDIKPEVEITVEEIKAGVAVIEEIGGGLKYPILFLAGEYSLPSDQARSFLAKSTSKTFALAEAYVIHSFSQKIVGNFYLKVNKPKRPTKIFTNEDEAIEWLKSFR
jgi:hypothetical protein